MTRKLKQSLKSDKNLKYLLGFIFKEVFKSEYCEWKGKKEQNLKDLGRLVIEKKQLNH